MSILHYRYDTTMQQPDEYNVKFERDMVEDLKFGIDLIFELKERLDRMHPVASEVLINMLAR